MRGYASVGLLFRGTEELCRKGKRVLRNDAFAALLNSSECIPSDSSNLSDLHMPAKNLGGHIW